MIVGDNVSVQCSVLAGEKPSWTRVEWSAGSVVRKGEPSFSFYGTYYNYRGVFEVVRANVATKGGVLTCSAGLRDQSGKEVVVRKKKHYTSYYNCLTQAHIGVYGKDPGVSINYTRDHKDGSITAHVSCPPDNSTVRYRLMETASFKKTATCLKSEGFYKPQKLATCGVIKAITSAYDYQTFKIPRSMGLDSVCTDDSEGQYEKSEMLANLRDANATVCGPRLIIPCLKDRSCTLNTNQTGCEWDDSSKKVKIYYTVNFITPVWSPAERREQGEIQRGQVLRFWDCSDTLQVVQNGRALSSPFILSTLGEDDIAPDDGGFNYLGLAVFAAVALVLIASIALFLTARAKKNRTNSEHLTPGIVFSNDVFADIDIANN